MLSVLKRRRYPVALQALAILLCAAIFAWGLHVRLSAYRMPTRTHQAWMTRLIQNDNDSKTRKVIASVTARLQYDPMRLALFAAIASAQPAGELSHASQVQSAPPKRRVLLTCSLFFRPPPVIA